MDVVQTLGTLLQSDVASLAAEVAGAGGRVRCCHAGGVLGTGEVLLEHQLRTAVVPGSSVSLTPVVLIIPLAAQVSALVSQWSGVISWPTLLTLSSSHCAVVSLIILSQVTTSQTQVTKHTHHPRWL